MKGIENVYKTELRRSARGMTLFVLLGIFFLLQLAGYFFCMGLPVEEPDSSKYIYMQKEYDERVEEYNYQQWDEREKDYLSLYQFVKVEQNSDYARYAAFPGRCSYGIKSSVVWSFWQIFTSINLILLLLVVIFPVFFFKEYTNGGIKNYLVAGFSRQNVFWGKWLAMFSTVSVAFLGTLLLGALFGGRYLYSPLLVSVEGKVKAIRFAQTFFTKAISFYTMAMLFSAFTAFLIIKTRSLGVSLAVPYVLLILFGVAEFVFAKVNIPHFLFNAKSFALSLVPVFHAFMDPDPAFSWQLGAYIVVDILFVGILLGLLDKTVRRQDV